MDEIDDGDVYDEDRDGSFTSHMFKKEQQKAESQSKEDVKKLEIKDTTNDAVEEASKEVFEKEEKDVQQE